MHATAISHHSLFDVPRAYLSARGKFWNDYEFLVQGDFGGLTGPTASVCTNATCTSTTTVQTASSARLDEAHLTVSWWKQARFRFGQFDTPISLETLMSDLFTDFLERSMASTDLAQGKSRGVMVFGTPATGLYYQLAYSNAAGKNTNDINFVVDGKQTTGRVAVNLAEVFGQRDAVYHFGGAFSSGDLPLAAAPSARTDARGITFFVPAAFTGSEVTRTRYGLEAAIALGPVKLQAEYVLANFY